MGAKRHKKTSSVLVRVLAENSTPSICGRELLKGLSIEVLAGLKELTRGGEAFSA